MLGSDESSQVHPRERVGGDCKGKLRKTIPYLAESQGAHKEVIDMFGPDRPTVIV